LDLCFDSNYQKGNYLLTVTGVAVALLLNFIPLEENESRAASSMPVSREQNLSDQKKPSKDKETLQFRVVTSQEGNFTFEAPVGWEQPTNIFVQAQEVLLVGPIDKNHHTTVFLNVSRNPKGVKNYSLEEVVKQLSHGKERVIVKDEFLFLDQHPARRLILQETSSVQEGGEVVSLQLRAIVVLISEGKDMYVLEYVSSPELYESYLAVFEHVIQSFHVYHESQKP
jgi:hypothetical protein